MIGLLVKRWMNILQILCDNILCACYVSSFQSPDELCPLMFLCTNKRLLCKWMYAKSRSCDNRISVKSRWIGALSAFFQEGWLVSQSKRIMKLVLRQYSLTVIILLDHIVGDKDITLLISWQNKSPVWLLHVCTASGILSRSFYFNNRIILTPINRVREHSRLLLDHVSLCMLSI